MINFRLKELEKIEPWGQEPTLSLHWFGLTDGDLWLTFGDTSIYEYSKEALDYLGSKLSPYSDYQLSRFIEDFTGLFDKIRETVPQELYEMTNHLNKFRSDAKKWLEMYDINENHSTDFYYEEYDKLISWVYQRTLNSGHLIGGPHLSFFRRDDKIRIVWDTQYFLENGTRLWTASDGSIEISYSDFVKKIKIFGSAFFTEMAKQVDQAIAKDWGQVHIDKQRLREEHQERENEFTSNFELLEQEPTDKTDWGEILLVYNRMKSDLLK